MNWYIGQDIVCIKTHSQGVVTKDQVYTINALRLTPCCKKVIEIDIGKVVPAIYGSKTDCVICGRTYNNSDKNWWITERMFAPLDSLADISELTEVLSHPAFEII